MLAIQEAKRIVYWPPLYLDSDDSEALINSPRLWDWSKSSACCFRFFKVQVQHVFLWCLLMELPSFEHDYVTGVLVSDFYKNNWKVKLSQFCSSHTDEYPAKMWRPGLHLPCYPMQLVKACVSWLPCYIDLTVTMVIYCHEKTLFFVSTKWMSTSLILTA
jgi:hypothetical protein